jgi:UDP-N-acetylmuramyl tripeptide synthase
MEKFKQLLQTRLGEKHYKKIAKASSQLEAVGATARFGFPSRAMQVVVIAGADSSLPAQYCQRILTTAGYKVGILSLVALSDDEYRPWWLQNQLAAMRRSEQDIVVVELDDNALEYATLGGVDINVVALLQPNAEDAKSSAQPVARARELCQKARDLCVLNVDAKDFSALERVCESDVQTYGEGDLADVKVVDITTNGKRTQFTVESNDEQAIFHIGSPDRTALYSALVAITIARFYEVGNATVQHGLL